MNRVRRAHLPVPPLILVVLRYQALCSHLPVKVRKQPSKVTIKERNTILLKKNNKSYIFKLREATTPRTRLLYASKDAQRSPLSNARRFISFEQLPESLRAHLLTLSSKQNAHIHAYFVNLFKEIAYK